MKYQTHLSKFRHILTKVQGTDLQQVLLRAAAKQSEALPNKVHPEVVVFDALKKGILKTTDKLSSNESFELVSDAGSLAILKKELIDDVIEPFKWDETLEVLLDGLDEADVPIIKQLLTNQYQHNRSEASTTSIQTYAGFRNLMIPIVRRIFGNLLVRKLVGVQPMSGPVGLVHTLQFKEQDKPKVKEMDDTVEAALQGTQGRKMTLEITKAPIEASSANLAAGWSIEAMADIGAMDGLNIEEEITIAFVNEVSLEISNRILLDLNTLAGEPEVIELNKTKEGNELLLLTTINRHCNDIARKTRRGAGNFIVISSALCELIFNSKEKSNGFSFESNEEIKSDGCLTSLGMLNGMVSVYSSLSAKDDEILVGYKGSSEIDTGYIYSPYVPLMFYGVVINPETFEPRVSLMTRAGKYELDTGGDYYSNIKIKGKFLTEKETTGSVS